MTETGISLKTPDEQMQALVARLPREEGFGGLSCLSRKTPTSRNG